MIETAGQTLDNANAASTPLLAQLAWLRIRDDIICGKLRPETRLRIAALRDTYSIGASPIREALSRLVSDGFVVSFDRRGFVVAPISKRELRDLTDVRKLIEKEAARGSILHGGDEWEGALVAAHHRFSKITAMRAGKMGEAMKEWETRNEEFLEALFSGCASTFLLNFRRAAFLYAKRYMRVCLSGATIRKLHDSNSQLTEAALARDSKKLSRLIDDRLEKTFNEIQASGKLNRD